MTTGNDNEDQQEEPIPLDPGVEGVLYLTVFPRIKLKLKLDPAIPTLEEDKHRYLCTVSGTHEHFPKGTQFHAWCLADRREAPRKSSSLDFDEKEPNPDFLKTWQPDLGIVAAEVNGNSIKISIEVDICRVGLFGKGCFGLTLKPEFPHAKAVTLDPCVAFDHPLKLESEQLEKLPYEALFGQVLEFGVVRAKVYKNAILKLTIDHPYKPNEDESEAQENQHPHHVICWEAGDEEAYRWRVGCTNVEGDPLLAFLQPDPKENSLRFGMRAEASTDGGTVFYPIWEGSRQVNVRRPELKEFTIDQEPDDELNGHVNIQVANLAKGFRLPLEIWPWVCGPPSAEENVMWLMEPLSENPISPNPRTNDGEQTDGKASGRFPMDFLIYFFNPAFEIKKKFGLLRIPQGVGNTHGHSSIFRLMSYGDSYREFEDEELLVETIPPRENEPTRGGNAADDYARKWLVTGIASKELAEFPEVNLSRVPSVMAIWTGTRGEDCVISFRLVGDQAYWQAASPKFEFQIVGPAHSTTSSPPSSPSTQGQGHPAVVPSSKILQPKPTETNKNLWEADVPMKEIIGKEILVTASITNDAQFYGRMITASSTYTPDPVSIQCIPRIKEVVVSDGKCQNQPCKLISAKTDFFPSGKATDKTLVACVRQYFKPKNECLEAKEIAIEYDLPAGKDREGGKCYDDGRFAARITDQNAMKFMAEAGYYDVRVYCKHDNGTIYGVIVCEEVSDKFGDKNNMRWYV